MPITVTATAGGPAHACALVGPIDHTAHIKVDVSALTANEVDKYGYLKPNVPMLVTGLLVTAGATAGTAVGPVFGITIEAIKVAASNSAGDIAAVTATTDPFVAVATHGLVNRDIGEDVLDRAYTAAEIAGFATAGSHLTLLPT